MICERSPTLFEATFESLLPRSGSGSGLASPEKKSMSAGASIAEESNREGWQPILELAVQEVFEIMLTSRLQPAPDDTATPHGEFTAMVGIAGALVGVMTCCCGAQTASRIASRMLGTENAISDRQTCDALGEICNMIAGNFKRKLSGLDGRCMLGIPNVIVGGSYR